MRLDFSNTWQIGAFLYAVLLGMGLRLLYDFVRDIARKFRKNVFVSFICDFLYFAFAAVATFCFFILFTKGTVRVYVFAGIFIGFLVCGFTLSRIFLKILTFSNKVTDKVLHSLLKILRFVLRKTAQIFRKTVPKKKLIEKKQ